jgi:hypothetical protein
MGDGLTVLSPVQKGPIWRVRIAWPTGTVHHFGKFVSEKDASDWIRNSSGSLAIFAAIRPAHKSVFDLSQIIRQADFVIIVDLWDYSSPESPT